MDKKEIKFEDKIKELEKIVVELENGEVDLDDAIDKYTKAMKLSLKIPPPFSEVLYHIK